MREAEERKAILEAQDLAYQEALLLDQEKERLQQEEELREQILKDEIEKAQREFELQEIDRLNKEEEERIKKEKEDKQKLEEKQKYIPLEPENGPNVVELIIRLPDGSRISRKFTHGDTITHVKNWINIKLEEIGNNKNSNTNNNNNNFELISDFPRKTYTDPTGNTTLEEAGLLSKTLLSIKHIL